MQICQIWCGITRPCCAFNQYTGNSSRTLLVRFSLRHCNPHQPQARPGALLGCLSSTLLVPEILLGHRPTAPLISGVLLGWHTQPTALLIVWGFAEPAHTKGESMQEMYFFFSTVATTPGHEPQPNQHTSPPGWTPGSYRLHRNVQPSLPSSTYLYARAEHTLAGLGFVSLQPCSHHMGECQLPLLRW